MGASKPRERLYVGGGMTTMATAPADRIAPVDPAADAIAVRDGVIVAIGRASDVRDALSGDAEEVDLGGGHILPGINDAHAHVASWGAWLPQFSVDLGATAVGSIAEVRDRIAARAAQLPPGSWIRGHGWNAAALRECAETPGRLPTRGDLDLVSPEHPVVLDDDNLHAYWVNSAALRLAGVAAGTPEPPGGTIVRDAAGEPTGLLLEFSARGLIDRVLPPLSRTERKRAIATVIGELHRLGITSFTEPGVGPGGGGSAMGLESLHAYQELAAEGALGIRASILLLLGEHGELTAAHVRDGIASLGLDTADPRRQRPFAADPRRLHPFAADPRRLRLAGVKVFADGIPPFHTAWMHERYADAATHGSLAIPGASDEERVAELAEIIAVGHRAGLQMGIHATGDATVDASVAGIVAARRAHPGLDPRHYIIHADLLGPATIATMSEHRIGVSSQPELLAHIHAEVEALLGGERGGRQYPNRDILDAGVPLAFGSDMPVAASADWRRAAAVAVLRRSAASGEVVGAAQRIGLHEALHAYTTGGARQDRAETWKGSLEVGKVADFCVLRSDPFAVDPAGLPGIPVTATVVDGEQVFAA